MDIYYFIKNWKSIKEEDISFSKEEWEKISSYEYLLEDFIEKHENKVDWYYISYYQFLSEEFIDKYEDKVNWYLISECQSPSEEFIYKHKNNISHSNCLNKYYRLRYEKYKHSYTSFSIHTNNNYGIFIQWKDKGFNIKNIPTNIIFCQSL